MNNTQLRQLNRVKNKMIINRKVFHARMKGRIDGEISGTKVVRKQVERQLHWYKKIQQQRFHQLQFDSGSRNCTILDLSGRTNNSALLCRTPGNWISTKENKKSTGGCTIIWVTSLVCIRETVQCQGIVYKKPSTKGSCAIKITNQTFDSSLVVHGWHVHKPGEFINDKGNIWASHPEMLKATNNLTVHGGIYGCRTICRHQRSTDIKQGGDRYEV